MTSPRALITRRGRAGAGVLALCALAVVAGLGVAIAPQPLVADDLRAGRLNAPWGFSPTPAALALWVPRRAADGRAEQLAQWLRAELARQGA